MEPETLKGFIGAAEELGYKVDDPDKFLRKQQEKCFEIAVGGQRFGR